MDAQEFEILYDEILAKVKEKIDRERINDTTFTKLFDYEHTYHKALASADLLTKNAPEAFTETYLMDLLEGIGIDREKIIDKPMHRAVMGNNQIIKEPDKGILPEHTRSAKGLLIEAEPIRKDLEGIPTHGVPQALEWYREIVGLENDYDAIATNLIDWWYITKQSTGYGMKTIKIATPAKALELIHNKYFGLDREAVEDGEFEENIDEFYKDFVDCLNKIALNLKSTNPYRITDVPDSMEEIERVQFFRTLFFRILFIKILYSWNIIERNPLEEYAFSTSEDAYYMRLRNVFFKVFNTPIDKRTTEVSISTLNEIPYLNGGLFRETELEKKYPHISITGKAIRYIWDKLSKYHYIPHTETEEEDKKYITPKILGHIFEKTVDSTGGDRKGTGTYYTPKKITDYISIKTVELHLISKTNQMIDGHLAECEDNGVQPVVREHIVDMEYYYNLSASASDLITYYILSILTKIKICDPSVGSGAFLDSIAEKLEKLYRKLYGYLGLRPLQIHDTSGRRTHDPERGLFPDIYTLRRHIIVSNLYGVDIQEEAVEIAMLRLWLWLINPYDAVRRTIMSIEVEPLPNIDYNIMAGNSLIGYTKMPAPHRAGTIDNFLSDNENRLETLKRLRKEYRTTESSVRSEEIFSYIQSEIQPLREELNKRYCEEMNIETIDTISTPKNATDDQIKQEMLLQVNSILERSMPSKFKISCKKDNPFDADRIRVLDGITCYVSRKTGKVTSISNTSSFKWSRFRGQRLSDLFSSFISDWKQVSKIEITRKLSPNDLEKLKPFHWALEFFEVFN